MDHIFSSAERINPTSQNSSQDLSFLKVKCFLSVPPEKNSINRSLKKVLFGEAILDHFESYLKIHLLMSSYQDWKLSPERLHFYNFKNHPAMARVSNQLRSVPWFWFYFYKLVTWEYTVIFPITCRIYSHIFLALLLIVYEQNSKWELCGTHLTFIYVLYTFLKTHEHFRSGGQRRTKFLGDEGPALKIVY